MAITSVFKGIGKRTKRAYAALFDEPSYLFGNGTETVLFPNGERDIWIKNTRGTKGFSIRASDGPCGFSVRIRAFNNDGVTVHSDYLPTTSRLEGLREVECIDYYSDEYAQAFKRWYFSPIVDGKHAEPYPTDLGLTPRHTPFTQENN
jgi:hypothetical protein